MSGQSSGEKTEQPTPKKIRDARKKGQVARSTEVVTTLSLFSIIGLIWGTWDEFMISMISMFDKVALLAVGDFRTNAYKAVDIISRDIGMAILPVIGVTILAAVAANYFQIGSLFSPESITPKLEKISPAAGFKRIFSMKQLVEILKSIIKIVILSILLYFVVKNAISAYISAVSCGLPCLTAVTGYFIFQTFVYSFLIFLAVALFDLGYQRHAHTKSLMMTKDEVKREYKESEGDPHIKGKRRQLAQELAMGGGGAAARKSTAVVVNPTHFAVAILYDPEKLPLPIVTAKGRNAYAHYLRTEAESAGVPIFLNVALARKLFADVEVDEFIPDDVFDVVAEILSWVERNKDKLYQNPLPHGVLDMENGDHRADIIKDPNASGPQKRKRRRSPTA